MPITSDRFGRRTFLGRATIGGAAGAALLATRGRLTRPQRALAAPSRAPQHLTWIWQFDDEGPPEAIRDRLARNNVGAIIKTHDALNWMSRWDDSPAAVSGPEQVASLVNFFGQAGVPVHVWCVIKGLDPLSEARMCAATLAAGAKSLYIDLEPNDGGAYWQAGPAEATAFCRELRRLQPDAWVAIAPDCRPWQLDAVPIPQFAPYINEVAAQTYWVLYNNRGTVNLMQKWGFQVGPEAITPELLLDAQVSYLSRFNLVLRPLGEAVGSPESWHRFLNHAFGMGIDSVSVWRYGTTPGYVWDILRERPAVQPPPPPPPPPPPAPPPPPPAVVLADPSAAARQIHDVQGPDQSRTYELVSRPAHGPFDAGNVLPSEAEVASFKSPAAILPPAISAPSRPPYLSTRGPFRRLDEQPLGFDSTRNGLFSRNEAPRPKDRRRLFWSVVDDEDLR